MLLFIVTTAERLLSVTALQLPVVNHLILYMLANTKSEFKRTLATLYPAIKAKLVSHHLLLYHISFYSFCRQEMLHHSSAGRRLYNPGGYHSNNVEQHAGATPTYPGRLAQERA